VAPVPPRGQFTKLFSSATSQRHSNRSCTSLLHRYGLSLSLFAFSKYCFEVVRLVQVLGISSLSLVSAERVSRSPKQQTSTRIRALAAWTGGFYPTIFSFTSKLAKTEHITVIHGLKSVGRQTFGHV
jgi:hypothetical protein